MTFVVGDAGAPRSGDQAVTVIDDQAATVARVTASEPDLVVLSSTVDSRTVGDEFTGLAVPLVLYKPWLYDDYGLMAVGAANYGVTRTDAVSITFPGHPLAGGLTGTAKILTSPDNLPWARPVSSAVTVATVSAGATLFMTPEGAHPWPAAVRRRRVASRRRRFMTCRPRTSEGWRLFDAVMQHAATNCAE